MGQTSLKTKTYLDNPIEDDEADIKKKTIVFDLWMSSFIINGGELQTDCKLLQFKPCFHNSTARGSGQRRGCGCELLLRVTAKNPFLCWKESKEVGVNLSLFHLIRGCNYSMFPAPG